MNAKEKRAVIRRMVNGAKAYCEMLNETPCIAVNNGFLEDKIQVQLSSDELVKLFSKDEYSIHELVDRSFPFEVEYQTDTCRFFALVSMEEAVKMGLIEFKG